jgi:thiamine-monophosphate kinase
MLKEFDLISRYFTDRGVSRADVVLGVGDDSALVKVDPDQELAIAVDTLVAGVHFPLDTQAFDIGYKSLAVNLSDMAAMGAQPAWATLALTLPETEAAWLEGFAQGFFSLADANDVQLIGGDTTTGPMTVTVQIHGLVAQGKALRRSGARPGDLIFVTGTLGDAGLALRRLQAGGMATETDNNLLKRLNRPTPRVEIGRRLIAIATSAIDISDGLLADLSHILERSQCGAGVLLHEIPLSSDYLSLMRDSAECFTLAATAGDDYELCFTAPEEKLMELEAIAQALHCPIHCIGRIDAEPGLRCYDNEGQEVPMEQLGYQHFSEGED